MNWKSAAGKKCVKYLFQFRLLISDNLGDVHIRQPDQPRSNFVTRWRNFRIIPWIIVFFVLLILTGLHRWPVYRPVRAKAALNEVDHLASTQQAIGIANHE